MKTIRYGTLLLIFVLAVLFLQTGVMAPFGAKVPFHH